MGYVIKSPMTKAAKKRSSVGPGRPLKTDAPMRQIAIRLPEALLAAIDQIAEGRLDEPDRTAIMRELLAEAIAARGKGKK